MKIPFRIAVLPLLLLGCLTITSVHAALVGWYRLEEGFIDPTTNTIWDAVSGSTNYGTLSSPSATDAFPPGGTNAGDLLWVTNGLAKIPAPGTTAALQFTALTSGSANGNPNVTTTLMTQDQTGNGLAGAGPRTITAWIQPATTQINANPTIVHLGPASPNGARVDFKLTAGGGGFVLRTEFQGGGVNGTKNVADGNWHFVAVVIPDGNLSDVVLYVDGVKNAQGTGGANLINVYTNWPVVLGAATGSGFAGDRGFTGLIDEVRIYNNALASSDIINLYLGPGNPPSLTQVANTSFVLGSTNSTVTLNAGALGTPPLNIQWKFNGVSIPGATNDALTFSPVNVTNAGTYTVAVTNAYGGTNGSAVLSLNTAPITPPAEAVLAGHPASFSVTMPTDSSGYTYQWRTNGVNITGATTSTLNLNSALTANAGTNYQVVVTLGAHNATSSPPASLTVLPIPSSFYAQIVLGDVPAGYWRLDENNNATVAASQTSFYPGTYFGNTGVELQQPGALDNDADTALQITGANYMQVPYNYQLVSSNGLTLETWVNAASIGSQQSLISCYGGLPVYGYSLYISAAGNPVFLTYSSTSPAAATSDALTGSTILAAGAWYHIVATFDGTNKLLYVNGALAGSDTAVYLPVTSSSALGIRFGAGILGTGGIQNPLSSGSVLDEPAIYSVALSAQQVQNHYYAGSLGSGVAPTITTQPASQQVLLGSTNTSVSFSVQAAGSPVFKYQWQQNGIALPNMTNSTLTLSPFVPGNLGVYAVGITNAGGGVLSSNANLTYSTGPILPNAQAVFNGFPATFTLSGMPAYQTYTYQWQHAGTNLPGATAATLTIPAAGAGDSGNYTVVATLGGVSAQSAPATLVTLHLPSQTYSNTVAADAPVAWWRLDDVPGSTQAAEVTGNYPGSIYPDVTCGVEGALLGDSDTAMQFTGYSSGSRAGNSRVLATYAAALNNPVFSAECWAMVSGGAGTDRSPLTSRQVATGIAQGYEFYADGSNNWAFWLGNGTNWATFTGPAVVEAQWVHLVGTYDGANAAFYVNGALVASGPTAYVPNTGYNFSIGAGAPETANGSFFFPGRLDEVAVYGAALSPAQVQAHYAAAFPNSAAPRFTGQSHSHAVLAGGSDTLSVLTHSGPAESYQWRLNGTNVPAATNRTLFLNSVSAANAGTYFAVATQGGLSATSAPVTLQTLVGEAVSVKLQGYENLRTIATNGGVAGYVRAADWNEIGYNALAGSVTNLVNNNGLSNAMSVSWSAQVSRQWGGPFLGESGDAALLDSFIQETSGTATLTLSNIPTSYQNAGYSLYVYLGAPDASKGSVLSGSDSFGTVSVGLVTNYLEMIDLAFWDGSYVLATNTNPNDSAPAPANYAVFTGLNSAAVTVSVGLHPLGLSGPINLSGVQLVANVQTPVTLNLVPVSGGLQLNWAGTWVLQTTASLNAGWTDVPSATSPYTVPQPWQSQQYFRLRSR